MDWIGLFFVAGFVYVGTLIAIEYGVDKGRGK